jgi:hypothetical protein
MLMNIFRISSCLASSILKTDLPQKEYLFRVLAEEPKNEANGWGGRVMQCEK